jgi:hypothetical protein
VDFLSDWAILNDTKSKQLERILTEFYRLSKSEIYQACSLLESYHAVYRRNRLEQRRSQLASSQGRIKVACLPPTPTQLHEIAQRVNAKASLKLQAEQVRIQLQDLAERLRRYRRHVRGSLRQTVSLDQSNNGITGDRSPSSDSMNHREERDESTEDLAVLGGGMILYRSQCRLARQDYCCGR